MARKGDRSNQRVAAISDIHGDLPALEAVLAEILRAAVDLIVCCGDVAAGPFPVEVIERLQDCSIPVHVVRGNADRELVEWFDSPNPREVELRSAGPPDAELAWTAHQLAARHRGLLAGFADGMVLTVAGLGDVRVCHGSPRSDSEIVTRITAESRLRPMLAGVPEPTIMVGHTHVQFDLRVAGRRWINPGSVGMPYEGRAGAYWALLGSDVELKRTAYDLSDAADRIRASGYPSADDFAITNVLQSPDPNEVSAYFEGIAVAQDGP